MTGPAITYSTLEGHVFQPTFAVPPAAQATYVQHRDQAGQPYSSPSQVVGGLYTYSDYVAMPAPTSNCNSSLAYAMQPEQQPRFQQSGAVLSEGSRELYRPLPAAGERVPQSNQYYSRPLATGRSYGRGSGNISSSDTVQQMSSSAPPAAMPWFPSEVP
jgi:hypothetical protein